jgi:hypothetical protein
MMNLEEKGVYFGYPKCCIAYFMNRHNNQLMPRAQYIQDNDTGFLPCKPCADRVLSGEITIDQLITNRECETTFPNGDGEKIKAQRKAFRERINMLKLKMT